MKKICRGLGITAVIGLILIIASYINQPHAEVEVTASTKTSTLGVSDFPKFPEPESITICPGKWVIIKVNKGRYVAWGIKEINGRKPEYFVSVDGAEPVRYPQQRFVEGGNGKESDAFILSPEEGLSSATVVLEYRDL